MENKISDKNVYLERMTKTFLDKAFFLKDLPENVKRIVDVGCADGSFLNFIDNIFPGRYELVGVENNDDLREIAGKKYKVFDKFDIVNILEDDTERLNTCVNFSSVFHEIIHYDGESEFFRIINDLTLDNKVGAVSVRDMAFTFLYPSFFSDRTRETYTQFVLSDMSLIQRKYTDKFREVFWEYCRQIGKAPVRLQDLVEFLMKYMYAENWDRERSENYFGFCNSLYQLTPVFCNNGYERYIGETFKIPYLVRRWKKDWGLDKCDCFDKWIQLFDTHYRALFVNVQIADK